MQDYFDLTGRVAIVTGASGGLGLQMAAALGHQGAKLALVDMDDKALADAEAGLLKKGYEVLGCTCDVSKSDQVEDTVKAVVSHFGQVDILVNNAGIGLGSPILEITDETWEKMLQVNINGCMYFARACGRYMKERGYGRIINMGSIHSLVGNNASPRITPYATTKGALLMFTKSLATEWAKFGITVNAIGPSYFESKMTKQALDNEAFRQSVETYCPMGRIGKEGELDTTVIYLASAASSFVTGQLINVDGGWTAI
ncbi:MAG: glucose 1-dehydrogenase [Eubacteriales bacterium]|nr:glucose 1-dehydrogenase [Eubacteriales bacterium]